jgi:hypothetical protein
MKTALLAAIMAALAAGSARWIACYCPPRNGLGYNGMAKKSRRGTQKTRPLMRYPLVAKKLYKSGANVGQYS